MPTASIAEVLAFGQARRAPPRTDEGRGTAGHRDSAILICAVMLAITKLGSHDLKSWVRRLGTPLIVLVSIVAASVSSMHAVEDARKVSVVSFGLFGDKGVFRSEATGAAQVVADRFGNRSITVQYNSKKGGGATIEGLARSLQVAANGLDAEKRRPVFDSHLARLPCRPCSQSGAAHANAHAVEISLRCWRGRAFGTRWWSSRPAIPESLSLRLAKPDVLVITAADANHSSFGCRDKAKWTYFGDAFFNIALRRAKSVKKAFVVARTLVRKRELREHSEPSNPLMEGGANVHPLLIVRP